MSPRARFAIFIAVVLSIWAMPHVYLAFRLSTLPPFMDESGGYLLVWILTSGMVSYPLARFLSRAGLRISAVFLEYLAGLWMGFVLLAFTTMLTVEVITLGGYLFQSYLVQLRALALALAATLTLLAWLNGMSLPRVVRISVEIEGLPDEADGMKVVHLSDLHLGNLIGRRRLKAVTEIISGLEPDLVAITGDLVDANYREVRHLLPDLRQIRAGRGVYAVLGNHEFYSGAEGCRALFREAGFTVLDDTHEEVLPGLVVAGVSDFRGGVQTGRGGGFLDKALDSADRSAVVILLQHSPEREAEAAEAGVNLMLNGHTHGGQIWPMHIFVKRFIPHLAGVHHVGKMVQVVSRGAGQWGPQMRLFAPSEIIEITLRAVGRSS